VTASAQHESSVAIERWTNVYVVAADHPAPHDPQARLDRFVSSDVRHACATHLGDWLDDADPAVCIIRELYIDLALDPAASREPDIASVWGGRIALEIRRAIESTPGGANVVRFSSRAAYIAHWARDMAEGRAWDQWYYADFQSLRSLPTSIAIVESMVREPAELPRILGEFVSMRCLEAVLAVIQESGAAKVFRALLDAYPTVSAPSTHWVPRVLAICNRSPLSAPAEPFLDALRLYTMARTEWRDTSEHGLPTAVEGLVNVRRILVSFASLESAREFLRSCANGDREEARHIASTAHIPLEESVLSFALHSVDHNPDWMIFAARTLLSASDNPFNTTDSFLTPYGGIFLLGPSFLDLDINGACLVAAQNAQDPLYCASVLRCILGALCMGCDRTRACLADPAIRLFAGIEISPSLESVADALLQADIAAGLAFFLDTIPQNRRALLDPEPDSASLDYLDLARAIPELSLDPAAAAQWSRLACAVLRNFAARLPGFSQSSPEYLFQNFLAGLASIAISGDRIEVVLPRCPLSIVLEIAGAYRSYELPWREGVEICLRAPSN